MMSYGRKSDGLVLSPLNLRLVGHIIAVLIVLCGGVSAGTWEEEFKTPPAGTRILKIIHGWPDQAAAQDAWINSFRQKGFGGVVCNVSFDQYLESQAKWVAFERAVKAAKEAGFAMWLYDERGYPSGNAGGIVLRDHPEWEARGLLVADVRTKGGAVELEVPPGKLVLAGAYEIKEGQIDLDKRFDLVESVRDGKLRWEAMVGEWYVVAITEDRLFTGTHADGNLHAKIPYVNLLMAEPTKRFVDVTYDNYAKRLGDDLSVYFEASFTDEPSLMSLFLKQMPYRPLPWSERFAKEFNKRRGYVLDVAMLPGLAMEAGAVGAKLRYDYWQTVGDLVSENYFGQIQTRCRQYHIPSGGHLLAEEGLVGHVPLYGSFMQCARRLDAPSIDCLTSIPAEVPWYVARLMASAAELEGRELVMSETSDHSQRYRPEGDSRPVRVVSEAEVRGTCNKLIVGGVNCITSYYSFDKLSDVQMRRLNDWVGRSCTAVRGGMQASDVAVLYPVESMWRRFRPSRRWTEEAGEAARVETVYKAAINNLFVSQRDFTIIDSKAIIDGDVNDGVLALGGHAWKVVVLPCVDTLPMGAWEQLEAFVEKGGVVIALGELPANSESEFPSTKVRVLAKEMFGVSDKTGKAKEPQVAVNEKNGVGLFLPMGLEGMVAKVIDGVLEKDVEVMADSSPVRVTHRRVDGREVYFVINDSGNAWEGEVRFAGAGMGQRWSLESGDVVDTLDGGKVQLKMQPYGATVVTYKSAAERKRKVINQENLPRFVLDKISGLKPEAGKGEFVELEFVDEGDGWRATGNITKSDVDTFLFVSFHYPTGLDMSGADCLVFDSVVPEGQVTPTQLLVIVHEDGGGDFLAHSGRSLAVAGKERNFVGLNSFQLTGWSNDADGVLDWSKIRVIRIGWGGYFGKAGEIIEFGLEGPWVGRVEGGS